MSIVRIWRLAGAVLLSVTVLAGGLSGLAEAKSHNGKHHASKHHSKKHKSKSGGGIPQGGGGDNDADNSGGPSDGDGAM